MVRSFILYGCVMFHSAYHIFFIYLSVKELVGYVHMLATVNYAAKIFCTTKETISKVKMQPSEWEKIIANEVIDKKLISKTYKQLMQLSTRKTNNPKPKSGQDT